ncbi:hypothetical protein [Pseudoxanthomonas winnipegensis]|uniref:hypothetical protein n=1 Tax=Pseudoxanthomonas winnipegensis TaxID=2480810 RepID=UPI00103DBD41|nr:hypothetical protein [Pseudoxanthomonas winnipegensis]TBV69367.1 hypothetical protein EYC45_19585 [Pseudoxanthomonas winnipegensis]
MKALTLSLLLVASPVLATDVSQTGQTLRQDGPRSTGSFGVRLTIMDPQEMKQYQVDSQAPAGSYTNPVVRERSSQKVALRSHSTSVAQPEHQGQERVERGN